MGFLGRGIGPSQGLTQHRTIEIYKEKNAVSRMRFKPMIPLVPDGVRLGCAVTVMVSL